MFRRFFIIISAILAILSFFTATSVCNADDGADKLSLPPNPLPMVLDMVHHNPGEKRYNSKFNNPDILAEMGFNGKVYYLFDSPTLALDWSSVNPEICPEGSEYREWVDRMTARLRKNIEACKKAGIGIYAMGDLILFPKTLVDMEQMRKSMGDVNDTKTKKYLRLMISQVFDKFPEFEGLVVRIGETYLQDAPYFYGKINNKKNPDKTIIPLIKLLRDEICVKRSKTLIFRTWMSFDTSMKDYMRVSDAVEPHEKLYFSIKHCEGDFHRSHPFSKVLGLGRHKQIVEVQCAREYEGKGAYPNYIANGVIEGFEEHKNTMPADSLHSIRDIWKTGKLYGVWTWTRGGGWRGPYIKDEMWCELNAWVMAQWALHPQEPEEAIFHRYATEKLGLDEENAAKFRKLALLSADAVIRGIASTQCYMRPYWTRDQGFNWPSIPKKHAAEIVGEKDEAVKIWKLIVQLAKEIKWKNSKTAEAVLSSSLYGLRLYTIHQALFHLAIAKKHNNRTEMVKWLSVYDKAWEVYSKLPEMYPDVTATLYTKKFHFHLRNPADKVVQSIRRELSSDPKNTPANPKH